MIISQAEIDLITNPRMRRRMMRLPAVSSKCPVECGGSYRLQPKHGAKTQATITITESPRREKLAAISLADAKREGYGTIQGALAGWSRTHGQADENATVWVIPFALDSKGEVRAFLNQDRPVFLAKHGDYTLHSHEAVAREDEVLMPFAEDLERARLRARERRSPQQDALKRIRSETDSLRGALEAMKDRNGLAMLRHAERELEKLAARLSVDSGGIVGGSVCAECHSGPSSTASVVSLEPAA